MLRKPESIEECSYFTRRQLLNEKNEATGSLMAWVFKGEDEINIAYVCPFCSFKGELRAKNDWSKKRIKGKVIEVFEFSCENCKNTLRIEKTIPKRLRKF